MDFIFITLYILFPVLAVVLMQKAGMHLLNVSIPQVVIVTIYFFGFFGTLPLYFQWDEYRLSFGVTDKLMILQVMLYSGFTIILVALGVIVSKSIIKNKGDHNKFERISSHKNDIYPLSLFFIVVIVVFYFYLQKIPSLAIFVALFDSVYEAKVSRSLMGNDFAGKYHWYSFIIHDVANIITFSFFSIYLTTKRKIFAIATLIAFLVSAFSALMSTEKGPFAWLIIGLFLVYVIIVYKGRYPIKKLILFLGFISLLIASSYMLFMGDESLEQALMSVFSRRFAGSIQPAYHYLEYFPEYQNYLYGRSFPNPGGLLPFQPYHMTREVMDWVSTSDFNQGVVGTMPTVFWGEAYANFGLVGILTVPFFIGIILNGADFIISKFADSPVKVGFYVWVILHYKDLSVTGFSGFIIDISLISMFLIFIVIISLGNNFRLKFK